ncbi:hypothetical protein DY000_02016762 [Brassica cretica]|uniref:DUF1618 domain-containing protein n=1 Tax=Brassica cretica TaxID=69181 RepID=A0ABQ7D5I6_BRACR|nr:hypothetical protein DY000_02016762 [Brassica cretica]
MAHGRKRIRNMVAGPYYAATFFSRLDPSASSSGTASAQEHVPESQSQGRSRQTTLAPYVPLTQYVPPAPTDRFRHHQGKLPAHASEVVSYTVPCLEDLFQVICGDESPKEQCWRLEVEGRVLRDGTKPIYVIDDVWKGLKVYWNLPKSVRRSLKCSAARLTSDAEGNLPIPYTSEQTPHAGRRDLQIAAQEGAPSALS